MCALVSDPQSSLLLPTHIPKGIFSLSDLCYAVWLEFELYSPKRIKKHLERDVRVLNV